LEAIFEYSNIFVDTFAVKRESTIPIGGNLGPAKQIRTDAAAAAHSSGSVLENVLSLNGRVDADFIACEHSNCRI